MNESNIFHLINTTEKINNINIVLFTKEFSYSLGISPILVLFELHRKGPQKQIELSEMLGFTKGALTSISQKLVDLSLAVRIYDRNDRRIVRLKITEKGIRALEEATEIGKKIYFNLFNSFTEAELEEYLRLQKKLLNASLTKTDETDN